MQLATTAVSMSQYGLIGSNLGGKPLEFPDVVVFFSFVF